MKQTIKIGTRSSALAMWQAQHVQQLLKKNEIFSTLINIASSGDLNQETPLHQMGGVGIFTKALDDALLQREIDCAVHSCKDLPSELHPELEIAAYLEREDYRDIVICKHDPEFYTKKTSAVVATGSVRRKAQWLSAFPQHQLVDLRGNVGTRLDKLKRENWDAAIFAYAGIKRLQIEPQHYFFPKWMLSAPAQGVVVVVCRKNDAAVMQHLKKLNHHETEITTQIERDFLRRMEGGCIAPIGALATWQQQSIHFDIAVHNTNGSEKVQLHFEQNKQDYQQLSEIAFKAAAEQGAVKIIQSLQR